MCRYVYSLSPYQSKHASCQRFINYCNDTKNWIHNFKQLLSIWGGAITQAAYFLVTLEFQNPTFSDVNTAPTMEVHTVIMLILLIIGNEIYKVWVPKFFLFLSAVWNVQTCKFACLFLPLREEHTLRSWDSVVCIVTTLLDNPGIIVQFQAGQDFLLQDAKSSYGTHSTSTSMDARCSSPGIIWPGCKIDHSLPTSGKSKD